MARLSWNVKGRIKGEMRAETLGQGNDVAKGAGKERIAHWFLYSAIAILIITGLGKVSLAFGTAKILAVSDPILGVSFRWLLPAVGALELVVAGVCMLRRIPRQSKLLLILWLSCAFMIYRSGLWLMNWQHPCNCLGSFASALHISDTTADLIMKCVLGYLLVGSIVMLWLERQQMHRNVEPDSSE